MVKYLIVLLLIIGCSGPERLYKVTVDNTVYYTTNELPFDCEDGYKFWSTQKQDYVLVSVGKITIERVK